MASSAAAAMSCPLPPAQLLLLLRRAAGGSGSALLAAAAQAASSSSRLYSSSSTQQRPVALRKLLVANRGEIACRVLATARRLGVPTVAVFSEADRGAKFVELADEAYLVGPPPARESYLRGDLILGVARRAGADAIHPGYGFLSENAAFAEACAAAGVAFVGPPADAIRSMGDKARAKALMAAAGVPVVPGYHGGDQDEATLRREAAAVGFPLLVKAVSGGGGKGMKLATDESELDAAIASARREAAASFNDDRLLLERFVRRPRHVEVQVMCDAHGGAWYLHDRDCSVQRRHQKIIEEAPAPGLPPEFHAAIGEAAVRAARAVGYRSAGTVEFIVDVGEQQQQQQGLGAAAKPPPPFFFMEMNTRLQVEHPVTESVTGHDLVELQLRVAAGEALPLDQEAIVAAGPRGHAFEARLYAENVRRGFLPSGGRVLRWRTPHGAAEFGPPDAPLRVDNGVREGDVVGTHYDPMIAKVVAAGPDRAAALASLRAALGDTRVAGLPTNLRFLQDLAAHPAFAGSGGGAAAAAAGLDLDTGFIERHRQSLLGPPPPLDADVAAVAGALWARLSAPAAPAATVASCGGANPAMAAWFAGDAKRLWHDHSKVLTLRSDDVPAAAAAGGDDDGDGDAALESAAGPGELQLRLTYLPGGDFDVAVVSGAGGGDENSTPHTSGGEEAAAAAAATVAAPTSRRVARLAVDRVSGAWSAEVGGRRAAGEALLYAAGAERVLCVWLGGRGYEFRQPLPTWSKEARPADGDDGGGGGGDHHSHSHSQHSGGGGAAAAAGARAVVAPMPGKLVKVLVEDGQRVARGAPLVVLECMKMEHVVAAPCAGAVDGAALLHVGGQVDDGAELLRIVALREEGKGKGA